MRTLPRAGPERKMFRRANLVPTKHDLKYKHVITTSVRKCPAAVDHERGHVSEDRCSKSFAHLGWCGLVVQNSPNLVEVLRMLNTCSGFDSTRTTVLVFVLCHLCQCQTRKRWRYNRVLCMDQVPTGPRKK